MPFKYVGARVRDAYKREERLTTQEWFEQKIVISNPQVSPITGPFRIRFSPHLKYLMYLWDIPKNREFYAKWASQSAKSFFLVGISAKRLDTEPANVLYMQPIKDDIPKIVNLKIDPLLRCVPTLWRKFEDYKFDESIRAKREIKRLAGGNLIITGSGVKDRKSLTVPMLVFDEAGEFESGTISEAKERTKTFDKFFPKIFGASTIVHPMDEICQAHDGCQAKLEWQYVCPSCKDTFYPDRELFRFTSRFDFSVVKECTEEEVRDADYIEEAVRSAHVQCPHCAYKINSKEKDRMVLNEEMKWVYVEGSEASTTFGISMNSLGSYFVTFDTLVTELVKAEGDPIKLDKVYRGWFNTFYERTVETIDENDMLLLGNGLSRWEIPKDTYKLYMGVDTQKDHFWVEVKAFEYGRVSHSVWSGRVETFEQIEDIWVFGQNITDHNGNFWQISKMGVDRRGYNQDGVRRTDEVDAFVAYMVSKYKTGEEDRVYCTEGHSALVGDRSIQIVNHKDLSANRVKRDIKIIKMNGLYLKNTLSRSIERGITRARAAEGSPEATWASNIFYINQEDIEADRLGTTSKSYTRQLTSEVFGYDKDPKTGKMRDEKSWVRVSKDNHLWDTSVICEAFAEMDKVALAVRPMADGLREVLVGLSVT